MSRTYRHCPNWAIKSYESDQREPDFFRYQRKPWSHRIKLRGNKRPVLHDGNFQRRPHTRYELRVHRRQRRHQAKLAIKRGDPDYVADLLGPWCRICGRPAPNNH